MIRIDRQRPTVGEYGRPEAFGLKRGVAEVRIEFGIRSAGGNDPREQSLGVSKSLEARTALGGVEVRILERRSPWIRIRLANGRDAWVAESALRTVAEPNSLMANRKREG